MVGVVVVGAEEWEEKWDSMDTSAACGRQRLVTGMITCIFNACCCTAPAAADGRQSKIHTDADAPNKTRCLQISPRDSATEQSGVFFFFSLLFLRNVLFSLHWPTSGQTTESSVSLLPLL